jgi:hypothetical protein
VCLWCAAVACGADFTVVATLSLDYYDTVHDEFDELSSLSDHDEADDRTRVTLGTGTFRGCMRMNATPPLLSVPFRISLPAFHVVTFSTCLSADCVLQKMQVAM